MVGLTILKEPGLANDNKTPKQYNESQLIQFFYFENLDILMFFSMYQNHNHIEKSTSTIQM